MGLFDKEWREYIRGIVYGKDFNSNYNPRFELKNQIGKKNRKNLGYFPKKTLMRKVLN